VATRVPTRERAPGFERLCAALAFSVPLVVTLLRSAPASDFRDDIPAVTGLGLVPLGSEGWLSLVGSQLSSLLPLGGRWLRAASVGAFAIAVASSLIYSRARRLLDASERTPHLTPPLALAAALTAALSPTFQLEGTVIGGAAVASAAALAALSAAVRLPTADLRTPLSVGLLFGLTLIESHMAAVAVLAGLAAHALFRRTLPNRRALGFFFGGAASVCFFPLTGLALRAVSPHAWLDLGFGLGQSSLFAADVSARRITAFSAWLADVGLIPFALAIGGIAIGLIRHPTRGAAAPLLALLVVDLAFPASRIGVLTQDPFGTTRLLAVSALAIGAALGVQSAALSLFRARLPFATPASVLLVVFDFTLVFVGAEASAAATERRASVAQEIWTDEAFASLPPKGILLARSEAIAFRLWAAQLVRGERPDVVVVPATLLERGGLRRRLLESEPALAPLLRDIALSGRPGEYALTTLADARPLFVELDESFDTRLNDHIVPQSFFLRFRAHPVGRSDRSAALLRAQNRLGRVSAAVEPGEDPDPALATRSVLLSTLRQRALFLAARGDHETAVETVAAIQHLSPKDEVGAALASALSKQKTGRLDVAALTR
jgi:hypothetical protein